MIELLVNNWPIVLVVTTVVLAYLIGKFALPNVRLPYEKRTSLLTNSELAFFHKLQEAVEGQWSIHAMVRMADLIRVRSKTPKYQAWQNRIQAKHIDFLLCDPSTMEARLAVELDDVTHQRPDRIRRDEFVDQALSDAGLPLLRVDVQDAYDASELRDAIQEQLS